MIEIIGLIGSFCLAICALPQAIKSIKEKHSDGVSGLLLLLWFFGEVCLFIYAVPLMSLPLFLNTISNILFLGIIAYYKYRLVLGTIAAYCISETYNIFVFFLRHLLGH